LAVVLASAGLAGSCYRQPKAGPPRPAIPADFFALTIPAHPDIAGSSLYPSQLSLGALGHPSTLAWGFIEREPHRYDFGAYDGWIRAAQQHGLVDSRGVVDVTVTFGYTPIWAAANTKGCQLMGDEDVCPSPPARLSDWTDLVTAVVRHYNGVTAPHVKYYELWNEFNALNFWNGTQQQMVDLAAAAYPIVHRDPYSQLLTPSVAGPVVITGGAVPEGLGWMESYLRLGGARYADGGSFHGYVAAFGGQGLTLFPDPEQDGTSGCIPGSQCLGSIVRKVKSFRQVFDENGLTGKPMLNTEGSWGKNTLLPNPDEQAEWVARWFVLQANSYPALTQAAWYAWAWPSEAGQLQADEAGNLNAAGIAWNQVYRWLVGASFTASCAVDDNSTWTCPLSRGGGYRGLVVWNRAGPADYRPDPIYTTARDLKGLSMRIPVGQAIPISGAPLLLEYVGGNHALRY